MNPSSAPAARSKRPSILAIFVVTTGVAALVAALGGVGQEAPGPDPKRAPQPVRRLEPTASDALSPHSTDTALLGSTTSDLPVVVSPVSPELRVVSDRSQPDHDRLRPLVDGSVATLNPADVALLRRVLRDATDEDTVRNEAANHLRANGTAEVADDCSAVLAQAGELPRFRSFAAQHLGIAWLDARSADAARAGVLRPRLVSLLSDRDMEVRREALLALVRGGDPDGLRGAAAWLEDPNPAAEAERRAYADGIPAYTALANAIIP